MIDYIQIENFKSLKMFTRSLSRLNLFFGENSTGKSSVIQALLLLRQSYLENPAKGFSVLRLNGKLLSLGTAREVISQYSDKDYIRFALKYGNEVFEERYQYGMNSSANMLKGEMRLGLGVDDNPVVREDFFYLSAGHIEPKRQYGINEWTDEYFNMGVHGEYAVPFLAQYGESIDVPEVLCIKDARSRKLLDQASAWMARISRGVRLGAEINEIEQMARVTVSYEGSRLVSNKFSPINVGFGIPYVLPLVVGILSAKSNGLILIENPEAHLHPKAQVVIAELISRSAAHGTQIICESHSDHVINGIRVAVKNKVLKSSDLTIGYFQRNEELETEVCDIEADENGHLSQFPEGFLDEWGILMSELI